LAVTLCTSKSYHLVRALRRARITGEELVRQQDQLVILIAWSI
jgi:hypothetical protein